MKWIKASERLPEWTGKAVCLKITEDYGEKYLKIGYINETRKCFMPMYGVPLHAIEWLDETVPSFTVEDIKQTYIVAHVALVGVVPNDQEINEFFKSKFNIDL